MQHPKTLQTITSCMASKTILGCLSPRFLSTVLSQENNVSPLLQKVVVFKGNQTDINIIKTYELFNQEGSAKPYKFDILLTTYTRLKTSISLFQVSFLCLCLGYWLLCACHCHNLSKAKFLVSCNLCGAGVWYIFLTMCQRLVKSLALVWMSFGGRDSFG